MNTSPVFREPRRAKTKRAFQHLAVRLLTSRRIIGLVIALFSWVWRSEWEVDQSGLTLNALGAVFMFVMLHTDKGRNILFLGCLAMVAVFVLNLIYVEFRWDVVQALAIVLVVGACWFVDWERVKRAVGWDGWWSFRAHSRHSH